MALPDPDGARADDTTPVADTFLEQSYLTYILPFATKFSPEEALQQAGGSIEERISSIEQRDQLFFDETVDVYFILRAPYADEQTLRSHLRRLTITLDAHIVNGATTDRDGAAPASELIYNGAVEDVERVFVVTEEPQEEGAQKHAYAVWKLPVFLNRPRMRLQLPSVVFSGVASLKMNSTAAEELRVSRDGYMQSCMPSTMNLLESFADEPFLGGIRPQLSAQRVTKVAPLTKPKDSLHRISGLQTLKLRIYPVLHTRVRFSRPNTTPPSASMIALLELDFTPYFDCEVALDKLSLGVTDGTVEDLNTQDGMKLPLSCVAHDHLTFLYKLAPQERDTIRKNLAADLAITIEVLLLVRLDNNESNSCTPRLVMAWTTPIDFTPPVNPGFGQPKTTPIQRSHRPSQLSIGGGVDSQPLVSPSVIRPDALPTLEASTARPLEAALPDFGVTMTFTGPPGPVALGEEFVWTVFVVNRTSSSNKAEISLPPPPSAPAAVLAAHHAAAAAASAASLRKLMLVPIPRRRRNELRVMRPPSTAATTTAAAAMGSTMSKRDPLIADAVLDETVVHAMQRNSVVDAVELVCLSADVRVGPLAPNACAVAELRFVALREGVVGLEAVRVVDLGTQEHADVRDLPLVVVEKGVS
ncbi:TRAPP trafficking subunit Trs65-domain-containing protein [Corynascus novoguineensis]|uniref:TRAPP trafficking subunit Trs65-domain-containing protein n=1 Tax=Corynascus novoguineensis TaxID=1126955 RepID=A0AAN7HMT0_9PEZI|nr:TRAPP trafficking subunit Trs65-domain-containing protein [Corynascus novoguineensis]